MNSTFESIDSQTNEMIEPILIDIYASVRISIRSFLYAPTTVERKEEIDDMTELYE